MRRIVPVTVVALLVLASTVGAIGTVAAASSDQRSASGPLMAADTNNTTANTTTTTATNDTEIESGARLAGVIGAQQAEYESEVQTRALGVALGAATSNSTKAEVLANYTERIRTRIQVLQQQSDDLEQAYQNGNLSRGVYYGQTTALTARIRSLERMVNRTKEHASSVPDQALHEHGIDRTEYDSMAQQARNMTSPEAEETAKRVAGPDVGNPVGPPEDQENRGHDMETDVHGPPDQANATTGMSENDKSQSKDKSDHQTEKQSGDGTQATTTIDAGAVENLTTNVTTTESDSTDTESSTQDALSPLDAFAGTLDDVVRSLHF